MIKGGFDLEINSLAVLAAILSVTTIILIALLICKIVKKKKSWILNFTHSGGYLPHLNFI